MCAGSTDSVFVAGKSVGVKISNQSRQPVIQALGLLAIMSTTNRREPVKRGQSASANDWFQTQIGLKRDRMPRHAAGKKLPQIRNCETRYPSNHSIPDRLHFGQADRDEWLPLNRLGCGLQPPR